MESFWLILFFVPWIQCTWTPSDAATWQIQDPKNPNETCVLLAGDFVFSISYLLEDGYFRHATVEIPKNGSVNGTCEEWHQEISITWPVPSKTLIMNYVVFIFSHNGSAENFNHGYFKLVGIRAKINSNPVQFPHAAIPDRVFTLTGNFVDLWTAPLKLSYFCESEEELPLDEADAFLKMSHVQVQAFHETPEGGEPSEFALRTYCGADVQSMMTHGLLFIVLLFLVSVAITYAFRNNRKSSYRRI